MLLTLDVYLTQMYAAFIEPCRMLVHLDMQLKSKTEQDQFRYQDNFYRFVFSKPQGRNNNKKDLA